MCSPQGSCAHKVTVPCLLCLGLIKRTHKNFRFFNSFPVCQERRAAIPPTASPCKLKGDVGWESLEWLLWESPSLSGCFPALFPFYLQPVCCVCILKASEILRKEEPRSWASSFLAMPGWGAAPISLQSQSWWDTGEEMGLWEVFAAESHFQQS